MKTLRFGFVVDAAALAAWLAAHISGWEGTVTIDSIETVVTFVDTLDEVVVTQEVMAFLADSEVGFSALALRVRQLATSAVGSAINEMTAIQVRALVAVLLFKAGAIDRNGVVRPLSEWV